MDRLKDGLALLAEHVEQHGMEGPENGLMVLGERLEMIAEDMSGKFGINRSLTFAASDSSKLTQTSCRMFVDEHRPLHEDYWMDLTGRGAKRRSSRWRVPEGIMVPLQQEAA